MDTRITNIPIPLPTYLSDAQGRDIAAEDERLRAELAERIAAECAMLREIIDRLQGRVN